MFYILSWSICRVWVVVFWMKYHVLLHSCADFISLWYNLGLVYLLWCTKIWLHLQYVILRCKLSDFFFQFAKAVEDYRKPCWTKLFRSFISAYFGVKFFLRHCWLKWLFVLHLKTLRFSFQYWRMVGTWVVNMNFIEVIPLCFYKVQWQIF